MVEGGIGRLRHAQTHKQERHRPSDHGAAPTRSARPPNGTKKRPASRTESLRYSEILLCEALGRGPNIARYVALLPSARNRSFRQQLGRGNCGTYVTSGRVVLIPTATITNGDRREGASNACAGREGRLAGPNHPRPIFFTGPLTKQKNECVAHVQISPMVPRNAPSRARGSVKLLTQLTRAAGGTWQSRSR